MGKEERIFFWTAAILIIVASVFGLSRLLSTPSNIPLPDALSADDWTKGNPSSQVVLIEYADFQCPGCASYHTIIESLLSEFGGHMTFAYRHFPLTSIHDNATLSAQAAEAAGIQGKFWEMHDTLFKNQQSWAPLSTSEFENVLISYASDLGLDQTQFISDLHSGKVEDAVEAEALSAEKAGLGGTPTFFLNGVKLSSPGSLENFRNIIRQEIEKINP